MDQPEPPEKASDTPDQPRRPRRPDEDDFDLSRPRGKMLRGSQPGRERVRIVYETHPTFRRLKEGVLEATQALEEKRTVWGDPGSG